MAGAEDRSRSGKGDSLAGSAGIPDPGAGRLVTELREGTAPPTLAAVLIAWALTLAPSGFGRGSSLLAGFLCACALGAGLGGPVLARTRPRLGRHLGVSIFAALSTATWLAGESAIHPLRLDPIR